MTLDNLFAITGGTEEINDSKFLFFPATSTPDINTWLKEDLRKAIQDKNLRVPLAHPLL